MLSVVAVLALLIAWIATAGGGGGKKNAGGADGKNPASTITPGPSGSGPVNSQHPGGRDESGGGGTGGSDSGGGDTGSGDGGSGDGGGSGSTDGSGSDGGSGSGSGSSSGGSVNAAATLPASSGLPNCSSGAVTLSLRSRHNSYSPDQTPTFELTAKNSSSGDCKVDLGPKSAVLTITQAHGSDSYWSSADCPKGAGSLVYRVPAGSSITYTVKWDRKPSAPQCATPPAGSAEAGTYLLEAKASGFSIAPTSFVLSAD